MSFRDKFKKAQPVSVSVHITHEGETTSFCGKIDVKADYIPGPRDTGCINCMCIAMERRQELVDAHLDACDRLNKILQAALPPGAIAVKEDS